MYEVVLSAEAQKIYASADQSLAKKIARRFEQLEQSPRYHPNIKEEGKPLPMPKTPKQLFQVA
jgi:mRNA interferase RelE/StbE